MSPRPDDGPEDAIAFIIMAIAQHKLRQPTAAAAAPAKGEAILTQRLPDLAKGDRYDDDWHNWLRSQYLRREAEALVGRAPAPK
jgi:hypothetical protein